MLVISKRISALLLIVTSMSEGAGKSDDSLSDFWSDLPELVRLSDDPVGEESAPPLSLPMSRMVENKGVTNIQAYVSKLNSLAPYRHAALDRLLPDPTRVFAMQDDGSLAVLPPCAPNFVVASPPPPLPIVRMAANNLSIDQTPCPLLPGAADVVGDRQEKKRKIESIGLPGAANGVVDKPKTFLRNAPVYTCLECVGTKRNATFKGSATFKRHRGQIHNDHSVQVGSEELSAKQAVEQQPIQVIPRSDGSFFCRACDYTTFRKSNFNMHRTSLKHARAMEDMQEFDARAGETAPQLLDAAQVPQPVSASPTFRPWRPKPHGKLSALEQFVYTHKGGRLRQCMQCKCVVPDRVGLILHAIQVHNVVDLRHNKFFCNLCGLYFASHSGNVSRHLQLGKHGLSRKEAAEFIGVLDLDESTDQEEPAKEGSAGQVT